jgi:integrase
VGSRAEAEAELARVTDPRTPAPEYTWGECRELYLRELRRNSCTPRTIRSARSTLNLLDAAWGDGAALTWCASREGIDAFLATRQDCAPNTRLRDLRIIKGAFLVAVGEKHLSEIPRRAFPRIKKDAPTPVLYSEAELAALVKHGGPLRELILVASVTGCRAGELRRLAWADVDLDSEPARVHLKHTKSHRDRFVEVYREDVVQALRALKRNGDAGHVFRSSLGRAWSESQLTWHARAAAVRAGVYRKDRKTLHSVRSTVASRLVTAGTDIETVRVLLGHRDLASMAHYLRASTRARADALRRL